MTRSPRPLVEGAMLAAVAVVLVLFGTYVPLLGPLMLFAWPLPIIVIFTRHGGRVALLTVVVAGLLLVAFVGPVSALLNGIVLGSLGLALGWATARGQDAVTSVLAGTLAMLVAIFASLGVSRLFFHRNALQLTERTLVHSLHQALALYGGAGVPASTLQQMRQSISALTTLLPVVLPVLLIAAAALYAFVAFLVARQVLRRLNQPVADLPPFAEWQVPVWSAAGLLAGFVCLYVYQRTGGLIWREFGANLLFLFEMLLLIQGLAFAYFVGRHLRLNRWLLAVLLAFAAINPLLNQVAVWAGLFDSVFRYRKVLKRRWEGGTS